MVVSLMSRGKGERFTGTGLAALGGDVEGVGGGGGGSGGGVGDDEPEVWVIGTLSMPIPLC